MWSGNIKVWLDQVPSTRGRRVPAARLIDQGGSLLAMAILAVIAGTTVAQQQAVDSGPAAVSENSRAPAAADASGAETVISGYLGAPYTYPSDIHIVNPATTTDLTVMHAHWDAKPFKHPIYYGVRIARWSPANRSGVMVDFTHAKSIAEPEEEVLVKGLIGGAAQPGKAKIGALFKHMEFSHGHNMLTLNSLFRLADITPWLSPYAGLGAGVALPHTEVQLSAEAQRTYEYQYAGPAGQVLIGLEVRLPRRSLFLEYKLSFARMSVPLSHLETGNLFTDLWRQARLWSTGDPPPGGTLDTRLLTHHLIGGAGVRLATP